MLELIYRETDRAMREIAERLRSGEVDREFLSVLADHLDPDKERTATGVKLVAKRIDGPGAPPARPDFELAHFLELHIDHFGQPAEAVYAEAEVRFGSGRSKCAALLREKRRLYFDEAHREMHRTTALQLRESGHPDYQPLWPKSV